MITYKERPRVAIVKLLQLVVNGDGYFSYFKQFRYYTRT